MPHISTDHVQTGSMLEVGRTWIVLLRNVSHAVRVAGEDELMAALVLHAETGMVLGVSISGTAAEALAARSPRRWRTRPLISRRHRPPASSASSRLGRRCEKRSQRHRSDHLN